MYVTYGSTNLSQLNGLTGSSWIASARKVPQRNARGEADSILSTATVRGEICLAQNTEYTTQEAQDAIQGALSALYSTFATDGQDVAFRRDDGDPTSLALDSGAAIGGVQVGEVVIDDSDPTAFVTGLKWSVNVSALFDDPEAEDLLDYRETVQIYGGGPRIVPQETASGAVSFWTTADVTVGFLIQSGTMTGRSQHLVLPPSLSPTEYDAAQSSASAARPLKRNGVDYAYQRTWRYVHMRSGPFDLPEIGGV